MKKGVRPVMQILYTKPQSYSILQPQRDHSKLEELM